MKDNQVDAVLEQLGQELEQGQSGTLRKFLSVMGRFRTYSLNNTLLIAMQRPSATRVAGFQAWRKLGRHVRRGERGLTIMAPIVRRRTVEKPEEEDDVVAFKRAHVFDISQTEGKELPAFASVGGDPASHLERSKEFVASRAVELCYSEAIAPAQGTSSPGKITLLAGLPPAEEFSTLVHELAHDMLHGRGDQTRRTVRETEAEAVAYVVCEAIGLEARRASSDYIQLYQGSKDTLMESLNRIRKAANEIIEGVVEAPPRLAVAEHR